MTITNFNRVLSSLIILAVISLSTMNCHTSKNPDSNQPDKPTKTEDVIPNNPDKVPKDNNIDLSKHQLGETLPITNSGYISIGSEDIKMKLQSVEDSRCPLNVNCIQAGKAKVEILLIKQGDMASSVELIAKGGCQKTDGSCGNSTTSQGYKFTLISLTPYPGEDGKESIQQDKYVANVVVESIED